MTRYQLQTRPKRGPVSQLENIAYRSAIIATASSGASQRTVAALVGLPPSTLRGWVERGLAYPDEEPWGSFATQYRQAERGMAGTVGKASALRIQLLYEQLQEFMRWRDRPPFTQPKPVPPARLGRKATDEDRARWKVEHEEYAQALFQWDTAFKLWATPPQQPDVADMVWMERIREARHPEDYGTSKHRKPEPEFDANNWLEANGMDREQLGALLCDPPESLRQALADQAPTVYRILLASGFDPAAPVTRKADDETE